MLPRLLAFRGRILVTVAVALIGIGWSTWSRVYHPTGWSLWPTVIGMILVLPAGWRLGALLDRRRLLVIELKQALDERKQAEQALRLTSARLTAVIENLQSGILLEDEARRIVHVNQRFCELFGLPVPPEALTGADCAAAAEQSRELFVDPEAFPRRVSELVAGEQLVVGEELHLVDGRVFERDYVPIAVDGVLNGQLWQYREVTEQRRIEERLRLQAAALESAANAVVVTDRDGRIEWVNPAFTRVTGYHADEVIGQTARLLKSGYHDGGFYRQMWERILSGHPWQGEIINRRKDGSFYTEEMTITPVQGVPGEVSHFIAIKQDITERKRAEERLKESYERLSAEQRRLSALNAQLLDEHETVHRLTAVATAITAGDLDRRAAVPEHEILGNLARALNEMADGLKARVEEREASRRRIIAAGEAVRQQVAEQLHGSVQSKLLVLWYKLGKCQTLLPEDPNQAGRILTGIRDELDRLREQDVRNLSHRLHPTIVRNGLALALQALRDQFDGPVRLTLEIDPHLNTDGKTGVELPERTVLVVYRVVEEALTNTVKHAHATQVCIRAVLDEHRALAVTVVDDGIGFDPEAVEWNGIGLSAVLDHVEALGGTVQVISAPGQGTRIILRVPITGKGQGGE